MKKLFFVFVFFFLFAHLSYAQSSYVLPYPSTMPGGINYKLHVVWEKILQYWYYGDFGQFEYSLKESDKYLVEAKTLFEYNQFLLGYNALQKSNDYFTKVMPFLLSAQKNGKDITLRKVLLHDAAQKHIEVLQKIKQEVPDTFTWSPEKSSASILNLHQLIEKAISIRASDL